MNNQEIIEIALIKKVIDSLPKSKLRTKFRKYCSLQGMSYQKGYSILKRFIKND